METLNGADSLATKTTEGTIYAQTFLVLDGLLSTGNGDDTIIGDGGTGFRSNGLLLATFSGDQQLGVDTSNGTDVIIGIGSGGVAGSFGISNFYSSIRTGNGNATIIRRSTVTNLDLYNYEIIDTGFGDDKIIVSGIINGRVITMGKGDDFIDAEDGNGIGGLISLGMAAIL